MKNLKQFVKKTHPNTQNEKKDSLFFHGKTVTSVLLLLFIHTLQFELKM